MEKEETVLEVHQVSSGECRRPDLTPEQQKLFLEYEKTLGEEIAMVIPLDTPPWYRLPHLLKLNIGMVGLCMMSASFGYIDSLLNCCQAFESFMDFIGNPTGAYKGFIIGASSFGAFAALFVGPPCCDHLGRRMTALLFSVLMIIFSIIQTFSTHVGMFTTFRILLGCCVICGGEAVVAIAENSYPSHRSFLSCIFLGFYYIGSFLISWIAYGIRNMTGDWSWRLLTLLQVIFPAIGLVLTYFFVPESPRWLISKGKDDQALEMLRKHHAGFDPAYDKLVEVELKELQHSIDEENSKKTTYMDLFRSKANIHRSVIAYSLGIFTAACGNSIISYYQVDMLVSIGITEITPQTLINGFLQLWNVIAALIGAWAIGVFGRRPLFLLSTLGMWISFVMVTLLTALFQEHGNQAAATAVIPFLYVFFGFYDIAYTPMSMSYPVEVFPFDLRAKGIAFSLNGYAVMMIFNNFVNSIAMDKIGWKYYLVYVGVLLFIMVFVYFVYPETMGYSLEETELVFERKNQESSVWKAIFCGNRGRVDLGIEAGSKEQGDKESDKGE